MAEPDAQSPPSPPHADLDAKAAALAAAASHLAARSRTLPTGRDFHFYRNFPAFSSPALSAAAAADASLHGVSSAHLFPGSSRSCWPPYPCAGNDNLDETFDWLVNINDDLLEGFESAMDEFKVARNKQETDPTVAAAPDNGWLQVVHGRKKRGGIAGVQHEEDRVTRFDASTGVKIAARDSKTAAAGQAKVPFHIPTIPRPQDVYRILVNNKNQPFEHVWLERNEDDTRPIHPLEKFSLEEFIDRSITQRELVQPPPLESTPFKLVEEVKDLKELALKLKNVTEFAVDLEHNQYRSFQGLTCLMQISTRSEDFVVDTLKLRIHVGLYLREIFKDPTKRKVMHGADRDIVWLQKDFGIYVCNLFDTGQASRILKMERNSLQYLLHHFCGVTANKEYQNADWRLRPLPAEMVKYAREDTHFLLYIYDAMRSKLLSESSDTDLLLEVHRISNELCLQLYEKELLTDTSYLHIYGLSEAQLDAKQLAIVAGLYQWRDAVARAEDESTGYILPNRILIEIAKKMPLTAGKLKCLVNSKHPYVERHLSTIISIIRSSVANYTAFESAAEQLKKGRLEVFPAGRNALPGKDSLVASHTSVNDKDDYASNLISSGDQAANMVIDATSAATAQSLDGTSSSSNMHLERQLVVPSYSDNNISVGLNLTGEGSTSSSSQKQVAGASVQVAKQPTAFGAMLGRTVPTRKLEPTGMIKPEQQVNRNNSVNKILSSMALPFYYFPGGQKSVSEPPQTTLPESSGGASHVNKVDPSPAQLDEVIPLDSEEAHAEGDYPMSTVSPPGCDVDKHRQWFPRHELKEKRDDGEAFKDELMGDDDPNATSELSAGFERCFQSISHQGRHSVQDGNKKPVGIAQLIPFDYEDARKQVLFGVSAAKKRGGDAEADVTKTSKDAGERDGGDKERSFQSSSRRRQVFPASGNRSASYH